jgi:uncharacterized membrane protein
MNYLFLAVVAMFMVGIELSISKICVSCIPPESVALIRVIVASVVIGVYMIFQKTPIVASRFSLYAGLAGVFLGIAFILYFTALAKAPVSVVSPIFALGPLLPALVGIIALQEPLTLSKGIGLTLACLAIILLSQ